ncbi:hypothetical protein ACGFNU_12045 [Spirillospora sp. NPDC048911]|uniref:hypothetical protein n=1 Tax=Spirillospora sp. NPDC048911 TaxID=3364527 RepID=UPI0037117B75
MEDQRSGPPPNDRPAERGLERPGDPRGVRPASAAHPGEPPSKTHAEALGVVGGSGEADSERLDELAAERPSEPAVEPPPDEPPSTLGSKPPGETGGGERPGESVGARPGERGDVPPGGLGGLSRRRGFALVGVGVAACALVAVAGFATTGNDGAPRKAAVAAPVPGVPDVGAVETVLANRATAVREHDRARFLATIVSAPVAYQAAQAKVFDNLSKLPLESWQERYEAIEPAGMSGAPAVRVSLRYKLRGFDRGAVARTRYLSFASRAGTWVIVGDAAGRGLRDDVDIWDGGPLTVRRGHSGLVIGDAPGLDGIARRLDAAVPVVTGVVGSDWPRRAVALVPADPALAAALVGDAQNLKEIAALATVAPSADGGRGEDRVIISPGTFGRLNDLGQSVVLTHELTHVATGGAQDGRTPLWLIEGFADYVGYSDTKVSVRSAARELRREITAGRTPAALPGRAAFEGTSPRLSQAYQEAWLACRMIAGRYGEAELVRLYRAAGRRSESAALREVLGVTPARFTAMWREYLREELR